MNTTVHFSSASEVVVSERCPRCDWRFIAREGDTHCPDCTNNPLWDRDEDRRITTKHPGSTFEFMGWRFSNVHIYNSGPDVVGTNLFCWKRLFNPERPNAVYSQANFRYSNYDSTLYRCMPDRLKFHRTKECAAWLIAHWWEHYLEICPCLHGERDDKEDSNFRRAVIQALLWYSENLEAQ
jgi:hypothetical protein